MRSPEHFAGALTAARAQLTDLWATSVRQDPRIRSDDQLSTSELIDHVPFIIDEIAELVHRQETPSISEVREARVHVYLRLRSGYRARDLVRELSLLRLVLLDYLAAVPAQNPSVSVADHAEAARIVNLYIDEELRHVVSIFTESDETK